MRCINTILHTQYANLKRQREITDSGRENMYYATMRRNNSNYSHYKTIKFVMTSSYKTVLDKIDN